MRAKRFDYSLHPEYKLLKSEKAICYEPDWESRRAHDSIAQTLSEPEPQQKRQDTGRGQKKPPAPSKTSDLLDCVNAGDIFFKRR